MSEFVLRILATALGLWAATEIVPGVEIEGWPSFLLAALLLGIANAVVRPIVVFLTFPITLLTLGLFLLVVNGLMLGLVARLMDRFHVDGLFAAILGAIVVSLTSWFVSLFAGVDRGRGRRRADREPRREEA
jgi:putative membrane protein